MPQDIYLIEFNQDAESTLNLINIDLLDSVAGLRRRTVLNFGRDDSGWKVVGWADSQHEAHQWAEEFLHKYFSTHPERFPETVSSTSNLLDERKNGYQPGMKILPRQTYK